MLEVYFAKLMAVLLHVSPAEDGLWAPRLAETLHLASESSQESQRAVDGGKMVLGEGPNHWVQLNASSERNEREWKTAMFTQSASICDLHVYRNQFLRSTEMANVNSRKFSRS